MAPRRFTSGERCRAGAGLLTILTKPWAFANLFGGLVILAA